jgi:Uma2 family endonuclease
MTTHTLTYLDAIAHLPAGGTLILTDVPWEEYEQLLSDVGDSCAARITYDQGRLEIMSPSSNHESFATVISALALIVAEDANLVFEDLGSTTYKQQWLAKGVEPDACFYIQNASAIIGRERIDLKTDPPPDIVVEIDVSHESTRKLSIYAGMGVPEVWRYDGKRAYVYQLVDNSYVALDASLVFPVLTIEVLARFLEQSKTEGQTAVRRSFREWLRTQQS